MKDRQFNEIAGLAFIRSQSGKTQDWYSFAASVFGKQGIDKGGKPRCCRMADRRAVDPVTWDLEQGSISPGLGHQRFDLDEAGAQVLRAMRMDTAKQELCAADVTSCAWASSVIAQG